MCSLVTYISIFTYFTLLTCIAPLFYFYSLHILEPTVQYDGTEK